MNESGERPDPDALLRRVNEEQVRARQGKLRIFFGFAPGVGKTYRMLQVARDLVMQHGRTVLVGVVEAHRRAETHSLLLGLDILPRRPVEYRGRMLEEFDLDAALARKPEILLLDELAHTNAPGSRHPKRWQDAIELLEAGIDVYTTVNVQHVESLNDVVAQITHVRVRETVPDAILDRADEIELVDIAPEELLARLKEGKVYLPDQALRAAEHFFQRGNLLALRELALRRTAEHVDAEVQEYRQEHGLVATWPAGERILVCVGPAPSSERLIRAAFRMATGLRAPWIAAYVQSSLPTRVRDADYARLEGHLKLAESLGATIGRLTGSSVSEAVLGYARRHNVTRIVCGKPTHSRLRDRVRGSLLDEIVRGSGDIEVHVISGDPVQAGQTPRRWSAAGSAGRALGYLWSALLVATTTVFAWGVHDLLKLPDVEMLYLFAVMISAVMLGRGPAILSAALGVAAYDVFFVPPRFTFAVQDTRYFLTFGMMFAVGALLGELATRLRRQERDAVQREERTAALYGLNRDLGAAEDRKAAGAALARRVAETFEGTAFVLAPDATGALTILTRFPPDASLDAGEIGVARFCYEHGRIAGLGTDTLPGSPIICAPLQLASSVLGVLALQRASREPLRFEQREHLESFCRQAAFAFERSRLEDEARGAALRAKAEEMRASLLGAVSHDLRTPLAAITGAATALRDSSTLDAAVRSDLLETVCEEAERLERLLSNLLDMTRLATGAVALKRDWVPFDEMASSALTRLDRRLVGRDIRVDQEAGLPLLSVDPVLFEQVLINLLENAAKYTPAGSPIEIAALREGECIMIEVCDRGPGLAPGTEEAVFEKFHRGVHAGVSGVGLGLSICRAIVEAHGGTIRARARGGGGVIFRIELPLDGRVPSRVPAAETTP